MGKKVILFLLAFLIAFFLSEIVLMQRTYSVVIGAKSLRLINNCEMVFIDKRLQPVYTVVLDCPGKDSIRLWPLPVVDPWFEDWWELQEENDCEQVRMDIVKAFRTNLRLAKRVFPAFTYYDSTWTSCKF